MACNGRVKIGPEYIEDYNEAPHERNYITFVQDGWVHGDQDWPVDGAEATGSDDLQEIFRWIVMVVERQTLEQELCLILL